MNKTIQDKIEQIELFEEQPEPTILEENNNFNLRKLKAFIYEQDMHTGEFVQKRQKIKVGKGFYCYTCKIKTRVERITKYPFVRDERWYNIKLRCGHGRTVCKA
jgi:hypothetical protein